jgi:carnitine 3-dehydrogenase
VAEPLRTVSLLGGGVIGGGWAARFLLNGVDVRLFDPDPRAEEKLAEMLVNARRAYGKLTLAPLPAEGELTFAGSVEEAVQGAELVQESAPERLGLKQELLAAASRVAPSEVPVCSSTSGLRPSLLAAGVEHPERLLVGHPFNPVYLLPLVELCAGQRTDPQMLRRAAEAYRAVGMHPLTVRTEIDGFIADRLLEALWREGLWLVHDGVATVDEVDDAISFGAGLRWAIMGTFLTYRIAGGPEGMRHFLEQFGPALNAPWTKLVDVPELTPEFLDELAAQSDAQANGQSIGELERRRDDCLVAILHGLRAQGAGAGETLATWEKALMGRVPPGGAAADGEPLRLLAREVPPEWIDYNGHVHESRYLQLFGDATDALLSQLGIGAEQLESGSSFYTVETHLRHLGQLIAADRVAVLTQVLGADAKRLHLFHAIVRDGAEAPAATAEQMLVHVDTDAGRATPMNGELRTRIEKLAAAHAQLPRPEPATSMASRLKTGRRE